jgi:transcriptional regulator with XRE-family HTH domain
MALPPRKSTAADERVGHRIKLRRRTLKMSQTDLAEEIGVSFQQVQKYERGANRIGASRIMEIARALRVDPAFFLGESERTGFNGLMLDRFIALPEASDLITAMLAIEDPGVRRQVVNVAMALSKAAKPDDPGEPPAAGQG